MSLRKANRDLPITASAPVCINGRTDLYGDALVAADKIAMAPQPSVYEAAIARASLRLEGRETSNAE
jgi:hypothetical protein